MYRMVLKQEGPVCVLRVTDKKAQDIQGGTQSSAVTFFLVDANFDGGSR